MILLEIIVALPLNLFSSIRVCVLFWAGCPQNVLNIARLHYYKECSSPRNLTWFTRPFLLVKGWGLRMRLNYIDSADEPPTLQGCNLEIHGVRTVWKHLVYWRNSWCHLKCSYIMNWISHWNSFDASVYPCVSKWSWKTHSLCLQNIDTGWERLCTVGEGSSFSDLWSKGVSSLPLWKY